MPRISRTPSEARQRRAVHGRGERPREALAWLEGLSPWPEEFGLGRMRQLLAELGDPQDAFRAVHVVGTNGKTTTTRMIAALLAAEGKPTGAYTSPHVTSWAERIQVNGEPADLDTALRRVRPAAVHVRQGRITAITARDDRIGGPGGDEREIDAGALTVSPGLVDTHVHVNDPGRAEWEGFEHATRAAAAGGVTTLML